MVKVKLKFLVDFFAHLLHVVIRFMDDVLLVLTRAEFLSF